MEIKALLSNKNEKKIVKRQKTVEMILSSEIDVISMLSDFNDKELLIVLEAIEEISNQKLLELDYHYFDLAKDNLIHPNNSIKREAARIIGNLASYYIDDLDEIVPILFNLSDSEQTVVRWAVAFALVRIGKLNQYQSKEFISKLNDIVAVENNSGVKNQYLKLLKEYEKKGVIA